MISRSLHIDIAVGFTPVRHGDTVVSCLTAPSFAVILLCNRDGLGVERNCSTETIELLTVKM